MKLTNAEIQAAVPALKVLMKARGIRGRAAFRVSQLVRAVEPASLDCASARVELLERYTEKKDGKPVPVMRGGEVLEGSVRLTDPEGYRKELGELLAAEVEIAALPLTLADLEDAEPQPVEQEDGSTLEMGLAGVMVALGAMLVEDAPAEAA